MVLLPPDQEGRDGVTKLKNKSEKLKIAELLFSLYLLLALTEYVIL